MSGGVYDLTDIDELVETEEQTIADSPLETPPSGFVQRVTEIKESIDKNIAIMADFLNSLKLSVHPRYSEYKDHFEQIFNQYKKDLNEALSVANPSGFGSDQFRKTSIENLLQTLNYTQKEVKNIQNIGYKQPLEHSLVKYGQPNPRLKMVGTLGETQTIPMENVGKITAWWRSLNPGLKGLLVAGGLGLGIFGGFKLYDYIKK